VLSFVRRIMRQVQCRLINILGPSLARLLRRRRLVVDAALFGSKLCYGPLTARFAVALIILLRSSLLLLLLSAVQLCAPLFDMLQRWLSTGELHDPHEVSRPAV
jgi:hypothetical protein